MKMLIGLVLASISFGGSQALTCSPYEAQFIGKVKVVNKALGSDGQVQCSIQVGDFRFYRESMVCPLDITSASSAVLQAKSCDTKVGEEVSGVISIDESGNVSW